jgi:pullulanase/glycogen debranching enzyme
MGWQNFLIYEIHARRFTNLQPGTLTSFARSYPHGVIW